MISIHSTRFAAFLAVVIFSASSALAQGVTYKIDSTHSEADITIRHMAISNVHGRFGDIKGNITFDPSDPTKSIVEATIDTTTVDTGVAQRDTHLKSTDFFDVAKYPVMTFKSTSVKKDGDGKDYGLSWKGTLKSGDAALGDDIKIDISIEAGRQ